MALRERKSQAWGVSDILFLEWPGPEPLHATCRPSDHICCIPPSQASCLSYQILQNDMEKWRKFNPQRNWCHPCVLMQYTQKEHISPLTPVKILLKALGPFSYVTEIFMIPSSFRSVGELQGSTRPTWILLSSESRADRGGSFAVIVFPWLLLFRTTGKGLCLSGPITPPASLTCSVY